MLSLRLQPKQWQLADLLKATGRNVATVIGYGGAKGGSKSHGADSCALELACDLGNDYPGLTITIIRRVFKDLKDNHIDRIFEHHPELRQYYTDKDGIRLPNRSKIVFAFAENAGDVERKFRGGYESAFIFVDEAQQFTERELQDIQMAARWTKQTTGLPSNFCKTVMLFNPGGKGSEYIRRIFWKREYKGEETPRNFAFIHAFGWDNYEWFRGQVDIGEADFYDIQSKCDYDPEDRLACHCCRFHMFIYRTAEGRKYNAFPQSIREGLLLGNFDHFEGQYFAGAWDEKICVLTRDKVEQIIKPWWTRWMAQDWGFGDHDCHLWFVTGKLSPSEWMKHFGGHTDAAMDITIIYREQVISDRAEADLARDIVNATPRHERREISRFFLSQDAFGQRGKQSPNSVGVLMADVMRANGLPPPEPAVQDRINGWRFAYHCFHQAHLAGANFDKARADQGPAVFVSTECPNVIECIPMAIRDDKDPEDVMRVAGVLWEDVCVVGSTLIRAEHGEIPIERITPGMRVWTRDGSRRVLQSGMTRRNAQIWRASFSDGSHVECTMDHPFFTKERGFVRLDMMRYGDTIEKWSPSSITGERTGSLRPDISSRVASFFTGKSGSTNAGRFLQSITSTIKTAIGRITTSPISIAFLGASTYPSIGRLTRDRSLKQHGEALLSGTSHQRGASGTARSQLDESQNVRRSFVSSAKRNTLGRGAGSVPPHAKPSGDEIPVETTSRRFARTAWRFFSRAASIIKSVVRGSVPVYFVKIQAAGYADVYNLEVEGQHEYFANGILVHNCDAVRYGLMSMQGVQWEAPVEVRREEVYHRYEAPTPEERTGPQMTTLALQLRKFDADEGKRYKRVKRRR